MGSRGERRQQKRAGAQLPPSPRSATGKRLLLLGRAVVAVFLAEALDPTCGVDHLLLTRVERVAARADFHMDLLGCRSRPERGPARALDLHLTVFRMYSFLHSLLSTPNRPDIATAHRSFKCRRGVCEGKFPGRLACGWLGGLHASSGLAPEIPAVPVLRGETQPNTIDRRAASSSPSMACIRARTAS